MRGYKKCDITTSHALDYQYDGNDCIIGLQPHSVDTFNVRNVIHHLPDIRRTVKCLKRYIKTDGKVVIADCDVAHFTANVFLDKVWYRFVNQDEEIFISPEWRDYFTIMREEGFLCLHKSNDGLKDISVWTLKSRKEVFMEAIKQSLERMGYDYAVAIATKAEIESGAACGQLAIVCEG
jgi:SAM-dependent methyltransferase